MGGERATRSIAAAAARQHGCVSRSQLHVAGFSPRQVERRIAAGTLIRVQRGVYAVGHRPRTSESRWMAAVLALGPDAVLSHRAAAELWRLVPVTRRLDVTVPGAAGRRPREGIMVHRRRLAAEDTSVQRGIPVTSLCRTLLDLAAVVDRRKLADAFEEAQVLHRLRPADLAAAAERHRGARGAAAVRHVLVDAVDPAYVVSHLELRFKALCRKQGIPAPLVNGQVGPWQPDFHWPHARLVVETDGGRFHRTAAKRERDARKDAWFAARGVLVLRLRWIDVVHEPERTATEVIRVLLSRQLNE